MVEGFNNLSKRPHVPADDHCPELTDFEWGRIHSDLAHNVEMAKSYNPDDEDADVSFSLIKFAHVNYVT